MLRSDSKSTESYDTHHAKSLASAALTGGVIGAVHSTVSHAYPVAAFTLLAPLGSAGVYCWGVTTAIAGYNIYLDNLVASCVSAIGVPALSSNPFVDTIAKCALAGAAISAGVYGLFGSQNNHAQAGESVSEPSREYSLG